MDCDIPAPPVSAADLQDLLSNPRLREILQSDELQRTALSRESVDGAVILSNALKLPIPGPVGGGVAVVEVQDCLCLPLTVVDDRWLVCASYLSTHIGAPAPCVDTMENFSCAHNRFSRGPSMTLLQVLAEHGRGAVQRLREPKRLQKRRRVENEWSDHMHRSVDVNSGMAPDHGGTTSQSADRTAATTEYRGKSTVVTGDSSQPGSATAPSAQVVASKAHALSLVGPSTGDGATTDSNFEEEQQNYSGRNEALPHGCTKWTSVNSVDSVLQDLDQFEHDVVRPYREFAQAECIVSHVVFDMERFSGSNRSAVMYIVALYQRQPDYRMPDPNRDGFCVLFCHETVEHNRGVPNSALQFFYSDLPVGQLPDASSTSFFRADFTDTCEEVRLRARNQPVDENEGRSIESRDRPIRTENCAYEVSALCNSPDSPAELLRTSRGEIGLSLHDLNGKTHRSVLARRGDASSASTDGLMEFLKSFHSGTFDLNLAGYMNVRGVMDMPRFGMIGMRECAWGTSKSPVAGFLTTCILAANSYGASVPRHIKDAPGIGDQRTIARRGTERGGAVLNMIHLDVRSANDVDGSGASASHPYQQARVATSAQGTTGPFVCVECNKEMQDIIELECHYGRAHFDKRLVVCHVCGKRFRNRSNRVRHHKTVHELKREFWCEYPGCNKLFSQRSDLHRHFNGRHGRGNVG